MTQRILAVILLFAMIVSAGLNYKEYTLIDNDAIPEEVMTYSGASGNQSSVLAYSIVNQTPKQPLDNVVERGISLGTIGTVLHLAGTVLSAVSIPITTNKIRLGIHNERSFPAAGLGLSIAGIVLSSVGAIPSCIGAGYIEEAMEDNNIRFGKNAYWGYYIRSWVYEATGWSLYLLGMGVMRKAKDKTGPAVLTAGLYSFEIGAEVYRAMSAVGPVFFGKKAKMRLKKIRKVRSVSIRFHPLYTMDGDVGVACQFLF